MNLNTSLRRAWPWLALGATLLAVCTVSWISLNLKLSEDLALARRDAEQELKLMGHLLHLRLQEGHYQDSERMLAEWANTNADIAQLQLVAANGFVLADVTRAHAAEVPLDLEIPIDYSYRGQATLRLRADLAGVVRNHRRLIGELATVFAVFAALTAALVFLAQRRRQEAVRLRERTRELELVRKELSQRNAEMESFVHTVSHDLKAPLMTISGFAGFAAKDLERGEPAPVSDALVEIQKAAAHLRRLIENLLSLSRSGHALGPVTEVALADLVTQALGLCHEQITNAGAEVTVAPDLPTLRVDGERFVQVWQNLIDNAVKYRRADAAPRIDIGWSPGKTEILLTVRDNGGGIAEPDRERIFGLFQRLDTATDGSGVGLSIVKRVVEAHGGRVWVTSTPGEGSTFFIGLPAAAIASAAAPRR